MDHSFSIDTCLYNKDDDDGLEQPLSIDSSEEDDDNTNQVESEIGGPETRKIKSSKYNEPKKPIFKKIADNFSKLNLSEKVNSFKTYFGSKNEIFECMKPNVNSTDFSENKQEDASKILSNDPFSVHSGTLQASTSAGLDVSSKSFESSESKPPSKMSSSCSLKDISPKKSLGVIDKEPELDGKLTKLKSCNLPPAVPEQPVTPSKTNKHELNRETLEKVSELFVENTDFLARMAMDDNQHMLADKLVCGAFRKLNEVFEGGNREKYDHFLDSQGCYPLFNLDLNLPASAPGSLRTKFEEMARDSLYQNNLAERIFILSLLSKFKMTDLIQLSLKYHHPLVTELWDLCVDTILNKANHHPASLFKCRNNILNTQNKKKNAEYKDLPSVNVEGNSDTFQIEVEDEDYYFSRCNTEVFSSLSPDISFTRSQFDLVSENSRLDVTKDPSDKASARDKWYREVHIKQTDLMSYLVRTNRLYNSPRAELLISNFNLAGTRGSDHWIFEPNNCLPTYNSSDKELISIKVRGKLPCHIITALKIITDIDISHQWIPFVKESKNLHIHSRTSRLFKQVFEYPVIGHKEALIYALSTNLLDEANCVIISTSNSPSSKKDGEALIRTLNKGGMRETSNYIKVEKNECTFKGFNLTKIPKKQNQKTGEMCFVLYPYSERETLMEIYGTLHQESKVIPAKFVTFLLKKVITGMFRKMAAVSKNLEQSNSEEESSDLIRWMKELHKKYRESNPQSLAEDEELTFYTYSV